MKRFLVGTVINAVGLWFTTLVVTAIHMNPYGGNDVWPTIGSFLLVGAIFGLVNSIIAPVIKVLAFPLYLLTFGLISFFVNGFLLIFVAYLSGLVSSNQGIVIQGFSDAGLTWEALGWAILGSIVMSVVSFFTRGTFKVLRLL